MAKANSDAPSLTEAVGRFFREIVNSNGYGHDVYEEIVHLMAAACQNDDPDEALHPDPPVPPAQAAPIPEETVGEAT
jgi:hypothetical protein